MDALRKKADQIAESLSQGRVDTYGGYWDQWLYRDVDGVLSIVRASLDHDGAPELTILPLEEFVREYGWAIYDDEEDEELA